MDTNNQLTSLLFLIIR